MGASGRRFNSPDFILTMNGLNVTRCRYAEMRSESLDCRTDDSNGTQRLLFFPQVFKNLTNANQTDDLFNNYQYKLLVKYNNTKENDINTPKIDGETPKNKEKWL